MTQSLADCSLVDAIEAIYDAAPDPLKWPRALSAIADCFGDVGSILIWGRDDGSYGTIVSDNLAETQRDYQLNWASRDIRAQRSSERGLFFSGEPFTERHVVSDEEILVDPFYTQFLAQHQMGWFAAIAVSPILHVGVALSVQRNAVKKRAYTDTELATLARIGPHVEKSLRLSIRLLDAELINVSLGEALSRLDFGIFVLDSLGRVTFSNSSGQRLLGQHLETIAGRLCIGLGSERASIDAAITRTLRGKPADLVEDPKPIVVQRTSSDRPLVVYLLPVTTPLNLAEQFLTHARAIVLVVEPKIGEPADPAVVRDILGLTLGEARIAALVGFGLPPREAATRLGITEDTARNVLKRVFSKVGVSRQSELVALLTKLVLR